MTKPEKKSIADLIATKPLSRKPSASEIDAITSKIHEPNKIIDDKSTSIQVRRKIKISVNAPMDLYIKAKTKATILDESLMGYIIRLIEDDVKHDIA